MHSYSTFLVLAHALVFFLVRCEPIVDTTHGQVRGYTSSEYGLDVDVFLAIPYAEPPTLNNRFREPVPKVPWAPEVLDATVFGPSCPQNFSTQPDVIVGDLPNTDIDEDCLLLNIYKPNSAENEPHAVMVWIHGGGLMIGQGMGYDGIVLAGMFEVILVNINYRLGALGFLSTADEHSPGNFGILDQILALEWIKANIASFGGDPGRITIFGESAGGFSTTTLALSPRAESLFQRVIAQSGALYYTWLVNDPVPFAHKLGYDVGCDTTENPDLTDHGQLVDCLRDIPLDDILSAQAENYFMLVVDGEVITHPLDEFVDLSNFQRYDILLGTNSYEATLALPLIDYPLEEGLPQDLFETYISLNQRYYIDSTNTELITNATIFKYTDWYNLDDDHIRRDQYFHFYSDELFLSPTVKFVRDHGEFRIPPTNPRGNTYQYYFDHRSSYLPFEDYIDGAGHVTEIPYVFGSFLIPGYNVTVEEEDLCRTMTTYWTNFAKTGDPNSPVSEDTPIKWPIFENTNEHLLHLTVNLTDDNIREKIRADYMAFWLEYVPELIALNCSEQIGSASPNAHHSGPVDPMEGVGHDKEATDCQSHGQVFKLSSRQAERVIVFLMFASFILLIIAFTLSIDKFISIKTNKREK
ncbi:acetylcholinesterase-like [Glandiceps talaboti]